MQPDGKEVNKDALEAEADPPQRVQKRVRELVRKTPHLVRAANSDLNTFYYLRGPGSCTCPDCAR